MSVSVILFLLSCLKLSFAYFITVDAHAEECFFDRVPAKTKMGLIFEIAEGGFLDIDVKIIDPDGKIIYQGERESSGKYTFVAETEGVYTYCFSNQMSTMTPKIVMFNMEIDKPSNDKENKDPEVHHNALDEMIKALSATLKSVKLEQEYMQVRDRNHREINESTNFRVALWSFFEAVVLLVMSFCQVNYLKRYFEVRRVV